MNKILSILPGPRISKTIRTGFGSSLSWSAYWNSLISATVENAQPTHVVLTFSKPNISLLASNLLVTNHAIASISRDATNKILTLTLNIAVVTFETGLIVTLLKGALFTHAITNNVLDDGHTLARYAPLDTNGTSDLNNNTGAYWDLMQPYLSLGSEISSGSTVVFQVYKITATQTNHYYTGCAVNDIFVCATAKTNDANNKVKPVTGNHLGAATALYKPVNGVFDGVNSYMKTAPFTWGQPEMIYIVFRQLSWTANDTIFDGDTSFNGQLYQTDSLPVLRARAAAGNVSNANYDSSINKWCIARVLFNGAASTIQINDYTPITFNCGAGNMACFTLASQANYTNKGNIEFGGALLRNSDVNQDALYNYLKYKYSIDLVDTVCDYDSSDLITITKDGSNIVSRINDSLGSGNDLTLGSCLWKTENGITSLSFNGIDQYLKSAVGAFTLNQPISFYAIIKQKTWTSGDLLFSGLNGCGLIQYGTGTPSLEIRGNVSGTASNLKCIKGSWAVINGVYNLANSHFTINNYSTLTGTVDNYNMRGVCLGANAALSAFGDVDINRIIFKKTADDATTELYYFNLLKARLESLRFNKGKFLFTFDGNLLPIKNGTDYLISQGLTGTVYVVGIGDGASWWGHPNYFTVAEVKDMYDHGIDIQNHSKTHPPDLLGMTDEQIIEELTYNNTFFPGTLGIPAPNHFAYPYGHQNEHVQDLCSQHQLTGRGTEAFPLEYKECAKFNLPLFQLDGGFDIDLLLPDIQRVARDKSVMICHAHRIDDYGMTQADFEQVITWARSEGLDIINISQLSDLLI